MSRLNTSPSRLLTLTVSLLALGAGGLAAPTAVRADAPQTVACAALCRAEVTMLGSHPVYPGGESWAVAEGTLRVTLTNTGPVSPPIPILMQMDGETPTFHVQVRDAQGQIAARSRGAFIVEGGERKPLNPSQMLMPGQSITFYQTIVGVPDQIGAVELIRGGAVVATLDTRFADFRQNEQQFFKNGILAALRTDVPLPASADRFVGEWSTDRVRVRLTRDGSFLRGVLQSATGGQHDLVVHAGHTDDHLVARIVDPSGKDLDHLWLDIQPNGGLRALRVKAGVPLPANLTLNDLEWIAGKAVAAPAPPAEDSGVVVSPELISAFKGVWSTGEHYIALSEKGGSRLSATVFGNNGALIANATIDASASTPQRLELSWLYGNGVRQPMSLIFDDAQTLLGLTQGGVHDGARGFRARRAQSVGLVDPPLPAEALISKLAGTWQTPFGVLTLTGSGAGFIGSVPARGDQPPLELKIDPDPNVASIDQSIVFDWSEGGGSSQGRVTLTPAETGRSFLATSTDYRIRGLAEWRGERLATPQPPATPDAPAPQPAPPTLPEPT
ncbi:MAG: hypothetical protein EON89_07920, partial [Brevundimonas sp.]